MGLIPRSDGGATGSADGPRAGGRTEHWFLTFHLLSEQEGRIGLVCMQPLPGKAWAAQLEEFNRSCELRGILVTPLHTGAGRCLADFFRRSGIGFASFDADNMGQVARNVETGFGEGGDA